MTQLPETLFRVSVLDQRDESGWTALSLIRYQY